MLKPISHPVTTTSHANSSQYHPQSSYGTINYHSPVITLLIMTQSHTMINSMWLGLLLIDWAMKKHANSWLQKFYYILRDCMIWIPLRLIPWAPIDNTDLMCNWHQAIAIANNSDDSWVNALLPMTIKFQCLYHVTNDIISEPLINWFQTLDKLTICAYRSCTWSAMCPKMPLHLVYNGIRPTLHI